MVCLHHVSTSNFLGSSDGSKLAKEIGNQKDFVFATLLSPSIVALSAHSFIEFFIDFTESIEFDGDCDRTGSFLQFSELLLPNLVNEV